MLRNRGIKAQARRWPVADDLGWDLVGVAHVAFLTATSEGELDEEDFLPLAALVSSALGGKLSEEATLEAFEVCDNAVDNEGWESCADVLGNDITSDEGRKLALRIAALVLVSLEGFSEPLESTPFLMLTEALGFSPEDASQAVAEALALVE